MTHKFSRSQCQHGLSVGLQSSTCWDRRFKSHRGYGCLSVVNVCVLSGRDFCDGLITHPEESYRVWCVSV
jgi:hypothetical protein